MINHIKRKYLFYIGVGLSFFLAIFLICLLATSEGVFYSICWGMLAFGYSTVIARIGFHLFLKDNSPEMWQITIYQFLAVTGWLIAIISNTWAIASVGIAILVGFLMMSLGTRFIEYASDWVKVALDKDLAFYVENSRWKFLGDDIKAGEDTARPICSVNGNPLTVAEAKSQGYVKESEDGLAYLKAVLKKEDD